MEGYQEDPESDQKDGERAMEVWDADSTEMDQENGPLVLELDHRTHPQSNCYRGQVDLVRNHLAREGSLGCHSEGGVIPAHHPPGHRYVLA